MTSFIKHDNLRNFLRLVESKQGNSLLLDQIYLYLSEQRAGGTLKWRCVNQKSHKCNAHFFTDPDLTRKVHMKGSGGILTHSESCIAESTIARSD